MRRFPSFLLMFVVIALGVLVGITAYNAGYNHGLDQAGQATQVVRYVGPGFGFFPFAFLLFPLLFFLIFGLAGRRRWRHWNGHGHDGRSHFEDRFDDWHRRQHDSGPRSGATI